MGADEEYLDNLLKSVTGELPQKKTEEIEVETEEVFETEELPETEEVPVTEEVTEAALFAEPSFVEEAESVTDLIQDVVLESDIEQNDFSGAEETVEETTEEEPEVTKGEDSVLDIDAMLKELNLLDVDFQEPNLINVSGENTDLEENVVPDQVFVDHVAELSEEEISRMLENGQETSLETSDMSGFLDSLAVEDSDVAEINELLEKADNNEAVSEDVLALYSAVSANAESALTSGDNAASDKKAEKEKKRKEKAQQKAAKKAAKLEAKAQKKMAKKAASAVPAISGADEEQANAQDTGDQNQGTNENLEPVLSEDNSTFEEYQEVDDMSDIQSLLGSLNLDELQFEAAPAENISDFDKKAGDDEPFAFAMDIDELQDMDIPSKPSETKGKNEKSRKEKKQKESASKEGGFFKKFFNMLFEEDEDEEEKTAKTGGSADINAENNAIMEELDKEDKKAAKKKQGKNSKKKGKDSDDFEEEDGKKKDKKPKKKKEPKVPKEKFRPVDDGKPGKKIAKGGVIAVVILAASVFAVIFLSNIIFSPFLGKQRAKKAFEQQNYEAAYQEFAGWNLNEEETKMRDFSAVVLKMDRRITAYEQYRSLRKKLEALDSLMRAVKHYEEIYQEALNCGAESEVEVRYEEIIGILASEYQLSEKEAKAIAGLNNDVEYTRYLTAVIAGKSISDLEDTSEELPGLLPEEEELPDINFSE
ncbi:MAG: hypothetical protein IJ282_11040 [Lachnospiraceae bacterium]|nr:hypothetical protein [Lachnospiraceae bacterium]